MLRYVHRSLLPLVILGGVFVFLPKQVLAVDCVGSTSGNPGTCTTITRCTNSVENPATDVCKDEQICCTAPAEGKTPKVPPPVGIDPIIPDPGQSPSNGSCRSSALNADGSCATPSVCSVSGGRDGGSSNCTIGGDICCVPSNNTSVPPVSPPGTGGGTGTSTSTTGDLDCSKYGDKYEKVAGVCFPKASATGLSDKPVIDIIATLLSWLLAIFGIIALLGFIISGVQYLISAGNEHMAETAKRNMQYSVIGIIVALSGWIIIRAIDALLQADIKI